MKTNVPDGKKSNDQGSDEGTDDEDLDHRAAKGQALRAAARRQAHKKREEVSVRRDLTCMRLPTDAFAYRQPTGLIKLSKITMARSDGTVPTRTLLRPSRNSPNYIEMPFTRTSFSESRIKKWQTSYEVSRDSPHRMMTGTHRAFRQTCLIA